MAIPAAMSCNDDKDGHEHDLVMPGFRFHPTEEELIEFYLRRKVEGKRFNVELITFVDLYRYDPWELPALAAIGEKEWFFYVPRDRKYRNGDRPNRVTTSGYWKATGADRMIRTETLRSIGLKKTLVFYSGKAPKGIRTSWIMNEYRLPQNETDRYQKAEISLCRVYKRPGVEDHCPLPTTLSAKPSTSKGGESEKNRSKGHQATASSQTLRVDPPLSQIENLNAVAGSSSSNNIESAFGAHRSYDVYTPLPPISSAAMEEDMTLLQQSKQAASLQPTSTLFPTSSSMHVTTLEELQRIVDYQHYAHQFAQIYPSASSSQSQSLAFNAAPNPSPTFSDKLWEWSFISDTNKDYTNYK